MDTIRFMLVDDHPVVREGLAGMLAGQPDFDVVATATDGSEALRLGQPSTSQTSF
jgi:DNA-binding NarL/FixJ family response regulator